MKPAWKIAYFLLSDLLQLNSENADATAEPTSLNYLKWMCNEIINHKDDWEADKAHRWVGYIQGVMITNGWSTLDAERNRTRDVA